MKKILILTGILLIFIIPISLFAENESIDKGSFEFGIGTFFNLTVYKGNLEASDFTIGSGLSRFNVGYFVINRLSIGGAAYYYELSPNAGDYEPFNEWMIGPIIKYYHPITERVLVDISVEFQYNSWLNFGDEDRTSRMFFGGGSALTFLITNTLGLKGGVGVIYSPNYSNPEGQVENTSYTQIVLSFGFTAFI
jgi:hypothetical protein